MRIKEFKQMVQALHQKGLRVVMDVVYNHTSSGSDSPLNRTVPGYYYRFNEDGSWSNASACGNETASERPMMRSYMIQSLKHWVEEYHIDGFRFDLMGIHDIETMNLISEELHKIKPDIFLYGEGWTAGASPLPEEQQALKKYTHRLDRIAAFSDDIRDGIKGAWNHLEETGFATGNPSPDHRERVKYGIVGNIAHPQIEYSLMAGVPEPWAKEPTQSINYVSCHDNHTLWDRIEGSRGEASEEDKTKMHLLANTIVFTSQGVPFLHAGAEFLRTKFGEENSFDKPDEVNRLDWDRKAKYSEVVAFYQKLIALRKNHPAFRMPNAEMIQQHLRFEEVSSPHLIAYTLSPNANGDSWEQIRVFFNGGAEPQKVQIPSGKWKVVLKGSRVDENGFDEISGGDQTIPPYTAMIITQ